MLVSTILYDVFWVYGTDVMESVAEITKLPLAILIPKNEEQSGFMMLGMGDIIIPAFFY